MSNSYRVDLEIKKTPVKTKKDFIKFYKKILLLKDFVTIYNYEYNGHDKNEDKIYGRLVLNKSKFWSLYKSVSEIKDSSAFCIGEGENKKYLVDFYMYNWKNSNKIDAVIEDRTEIYYKHALSKFRILFLKMWLNWINKSTNKIRFSIPYYRALISLPLISSKIKEIKLPFVTIYFDKHNELEKIDPYVEDNNKAFVEFIKNVITLFNVDKAVGRNYSNTSGEGLPIFRYSKKEGFELLEETL